MPSSAAILLIIVIIVTPYARIANASFPSGSKFQAIFKYVSLLEIAGHGKVYSVELLGQTECPE